MGESRVDVETRNEEEFLEEGIPTFEMIQKNPTRREEQDWKIADTPITGVGVLFVPMIVVQENIFKLNRRRKKKRNGQNHHGCLSTASS